MRVWRNRLVVICLLLLVGCNSIEHRSETVAKQPLAVLPEGAIEPKLIWTDSSGAGAGKTDARLRLAVTDQMVVTADHKGKITAVDRTTGNLKWQTASKAHITAGPTIAEGRVLVGTDGGRVLAYQLTNGASLWQSEVTGSVLAAPQGNRGVIFVHALDGSITAMNAEDGRQLWYYNVNLPPLMLRQSSSPLLIDNHVVVGFANGKLVALHRMDGQPDWEQEIAVSKGRSDIQRMVDISADPVAKDNVIYVVSYQGRLMALNADTGNPYWERELSSYSGLTVTHTAVLVTDPKGVIWAIDRKSGRDLWKQVSLTGRQLSAPMVFDDLLAVGDDDGYLHWFAQADGLPKGRILVDSKGIDATPVFKNNYLYVLGRGGKVAMFKFPGGSN